MAGHRGEWTPFWWRRHIDSTAQRTMLTPKHSETGIISVYIHEQYVYRGWRAEGVVEMQMSCLSGRRSGYNFHGTQGRTYVSRSLHVRIYIIIERKERFPSSTDCFPSRPCYFIHSPFFRPTYILPDNYSLFLSFYIHIYMFCCYGFFGMRYESIESRSKIFKIFHGFHGEIWFFPLWPNLYSSDSCTLSFFFSL